MITTEKSVPGSAHPASRRGAVPLSSTEIPDRMYFRIGDVAELLGVKPYILRYWESEFPIISPEKSRSGQRVYRRSDVESLLMIRQLLYVERFSIEGARKRIRELRKNGELKTFKDATVSDLAPRKRVSPQSLRQIRVAFEELRTVIRTPVEKLFRY